MQEPKGKSKDLKFFTIAIISLLAITYTSDYFYPKQTRLAISKVTFGFVEFNAPNFLHKPISEMGSIQAEHIEKSTP